MISSEQAAKLQRGLGDWAPEDEFDSLSWNMFVPGPLGVDMEGTIVMRPSVLADGLRRAIEELGWDVVTSSSKSLGVIVELFKDGEQYRSLFNDTLLAVLTQAALWLCDKLEQETKDLTRLDLEDSTNILIDALENIGSYGDGGICPYGCDAPNVAVKALVDYGNGEFRQASDCVKRTVKENLTVDRSKQEKPGVCPYCEDTGK